MSDSNLHPELSSETTYSVSLTVLEARALRIASIFGTPDPEPPEITSAKVKLRTVEQMAAAEARS